MTAGKGKSRGTSRRGGGGGRPWPCRRCRQPILWATVLLLNGNTKKWPVNATPVPHGDLEYLRGSTLRPFLRQLDTHQVTQEPKGDRYLSHLRFCRLEGVHAKGTTGAADTTPAGVGAR